jgi:transcriptional regulator with XRE-family HTH domain
MAYPAGMLTPAQTRAGRALLGWTQGDLSGRSGVSLATVKNYERGTADIRSSTIGKIEAALREAGVALIEAGAPSLNGGSGVRLFVGLSASGRETTQGAKNDE